MSVAWCWADKAVVRQIRERVPKLRVSGALAIYLGLCELASDKGVEEFDAELPDVAKKSGFGLRIITERIQDLEAAGVITVTRPKVKGPARFRLLDAIGTNCRTISSERRAIGTDCAQLLPNDQQSLRHLLPNPNIKEKKNPGAGGKPRQLGIADRIGLEKQVEALKAEIQRLKPLRLHQQAGDHKQALVKAESQLANIQRRLAENAEAIASS